VTWTGRRSVAGACRRQVILPRRMSVESSAHRRPALHSVSDRAIAEDRCRSLPRTADRSPVIHHHRNRAPAIRHHPSDLAPTGHAPHSPAPQCFAHPSISRSPTPSPWRKFESKVPHYCSVTAPDAVVLQRHPRALAQTARNSAANRAKSFGRTRGAMRTSDCAALSVGCWQWLFRAIRAVTSTARGNTPGSASRHGWRARIRLGLRPRLPR
jgi:hypothetical protein